MRQNSINNVIHRQEERRLFRSTPACGRGRKEGVQKILPPPCSTIFPGGSATPGGRSYFELAGMTWRKKRKEGGGGRQNSRRTTTIHLAVQKYREGKRKSRLAEGGKKGEKQSMSRSTPHACTWELCKKGKKKASHFFNSALRRLFHGKKGEEEKKKRKDTKWFVDLTISSTLALKGPRHASVTLQMKKGGRGGRRHWIFSRNRSNSGIDIGRVHLRIFLYNIIQLSPKKRGGEKKTRPADYDFSAP